MGRGGVIGLGGMRRGTTGRGGGRLVDPSDVDGRNGRRVIVLIVIGHPRNIDLRNTPRTTVNARHINLRPSSSSPFVRLLIIRHPGNINLRDGPSSSSCPRARTRATRHTQRRHRLPLHPTHTPTHTRVRIPRRSSRTRTQRVGVWCRRRMRCRR